jgi:hypothetical protein
MDQAIFDMYYILCEVLFGSVFWAALAMVIVFIITMSLFRVSALLQIFLLGFFLLTIGIGYIGTIVAVAGLLIGLIYFFGSIILFVINKFQ